MTGDKSNTYCVIIIILILFYILLIVNKQRSECENRYSSFSNPKENKDKYISQKKINELYELLNSVKCVLTKTNIPYIMIGGTLLGAVRNKGLIPWDYDADVVIFDMDLEDIRTILKPLESKNIITYINDKKGIVKVKFKDSPTILDVFVMRKVFDKEYNGYLYRFIPPYDLKYKNEYFTENELFPLKDYKFGPLTLKGPNNAISYLDRAYPDWSTKLTSWSGELTYFINQNIKSKKADITNVSLPDIILDTQCNN